VVSDDGIIGVSPATDTDQTWGSPPRPPAAPAATSPGQDRGCPPLPLLEPIERAERHCQEMNCALYVVGRVCARSAARRSRTLDMDPGKVDRRRHSRSPESWPAPWVSDTQPQAVWHSKIRPGGPRGRVRRIRAGFCPGAGWILSRTPGRSTEVETSSIKHRPAPPRFTINTLAIPPDPLDYGRLLISMWRAGPKHTG